MDPHPPTPAGVATPLAELRAEIDALDDAMHALLQRRADVVARLAESRAKGSAPVFRPGREAQVLRRLLGRHEGPLPPAAVVRLWRDIFAASIGLQDTLTVAVHAGPGTETERLAREHFGALTPLRLLPSPASALAAVAGGDAALAVLGLPREEEPAEAVWWTGLDSPRLQVGARLPFWSGSGTDPIAEALVVMPGAPDPSGADRALLRLELRAGEAPGRAPLLAALTAAGFAPRHGILRRDAAGLNALVEVEGVVAGDDPRLASLPADRALPLGFYAVPLRDG